MIGLLAQVPMPEEGTDPWMWVAGLAVAALAYVSLRLLSAITDDRDEWKAHAKELAAALKLNTETLAKTTDVIEQARLGNVKLTEEVRQGFERLHATLTERRAAR